MEVTSFFETLEKQYADKLPFVVYSRPINSIIKCWLQNDDECYETDTFTESGFVFSPFDLKEKSILFPEDKCSYSELGCDNLNINASQPTEINQNQNHKIQHIALVSKGIDTIKKTALEKVVLSRYETKSIQNNSPITIFKRLFNTYKNAMVYCWFHPKIGLWIGATPELLFKVEGKRLTTISLAGTQTFSADKTVKWTTKEVEEQQIVTDYISRQIEPHTKSISVSDIETVKAGNLLHLKTRIISTIKEESELKSIIDSLHPTPAVCGFPRTKAKDFIIQNENYNRNYYTGFLGELNLKQRTTRNNNRRNVENNAYAVVKTHSNFYVNLRCMQLEGNTAIIYVGGGITKDSNPEQEWEETVNKTKTISNVLD